MEKNFILAGFGGQGILLAGTILANAFMLAGKNVTWYPCYGAEMRGGTVNCEIVVSDTEVSSVHKQDTDYALVLNQQSFDRFVERVKAGGTIVANSTLVSEIKPRNDINYVFAPMGEIANSIGTNKVTNVVNMTKFDFTPGEYCYVYKIQNNLANSFICYKVAPGTEAVTTTETED